MHRLLPLAVTWFFGLAVVAFPLALSVADKTVALAAALLLGGVVATALQDRALGVVVIATVFQNLMVSIASPYVAFADFNFVRAFSFLDMVVVWAVVMVGWLRDRHGLPEDVRRMMHETIVVLAVVFLFLLLGLPRPAATPSSTP